MWGAVCREVVSPRTPRARSAKKPFGSNRVESGAWRESTEAALLALVYPRRARGCDVCYDEFIFLKIDYIKIFFVK